MPIARAKNNLIYGLTTPKRLVVFFYEFLKIKVIDKFLCCINVFATPPGIGIFFILFHCSAIISRTSWQVSNATHPSIPTFTIDCRGLPMLRRSQLEYPLARWIHFQPSLWKLTIKPHAPYWTDSFLRLSISTAHNLSWYIQAAQSSAPRLELVSAFFELNKFG